MQFIQKHLILFIWDRQIIVKKELKNIWQVIPNLHPGQKIGYCFILKILKQEQKQ